METSVGESFYEDSKRKSWCATETDCFLSIIKELNVIRLMDGKKFRTLDIFRKVEELFKARGYDRTATQLSDKFKAMKKRFIAAKKEMCKSGAGTAAKKQCAFYDELHEIFSYRPTVNQTGVDSTALPLVLDEDSSGYCATDNEVSSLMSKKSSTPKTRKSMESIASCSNGPATPFTCENSRIPPMSPNVSYFLDSNNDDLSSRSTTRSSSCISNARDGQYTHSSKRQKTGASTKRETSRSGLKNVMNDFAEKMMKSQNDLLEKMIMEQRQSDNNMMMQYNNIFTQQTQMLLAGLRSLGQSVPTNFIPTPDHLSHSIPSSSVMFPNTPLHDISQSSNVCNDLPQMTPTHRESVHPQSPVTAFTTSPSAHSIRPKVISQGSLIKMTIIRGKKTVDQQPPPIATTQSCTSANYSCGVPSIIEPVQLICGSSDEDSDLNFEDVEFLDQD